MRVRGARKEDVLKDAALVFFEAVDSELEAQMTKLRKREFAPELDNPERLCTQVDGSFARLEPNGEEEERFRFYKKRKMA